MLQSCCLKAGESAKHDNGQQTSSQDEMDVEDNTDKEPTPQVFGKKLYNLDNSVNVWSDFLRLHLHPKTIATIDEYQHNQYVCDAFIIITVIIASTQYFSKFYFSVMVK